MTNSLDHHSLAIWSCCNACLELITTQPETDAILELRDLLEYQYDIIDCVLNHRHFGSDGLDYVIHDCHKVLNQVREMEGK